ncbi:STAS domain-containing protein [Dactylosporangium sp. NPDC050588]|uniref:STAS domain-containing protein n=1 Tax=Dactylosporangium sp. NPDC050588 TaxID=3157211 RepID=UPI003405FFD5
MRLVAVGHLDYAAADGFHAAVLEAFDAGARAVTVDVAGIEFSDSSGAGLPSFARTRPPRGSGAGSASPTQTTGCPTSSRSRHWTRSCT